MKRKVKITLTLDIDYPDLEKETKQLSKDFDQWLKDWAKNIENYPIPFLYKHAIEYTPNSNIKVKITTDKKIILQTSLSEEF